ncbi:unnamed protein product [Coregonus sp. 'balchen']|nr:unnamed protein product [Coregonus sp. 'balchen']
MKLCLTCSVYYCEKHVRKHFIIEALRRHVMVDVTEELVLQRNTSEKKRREEQEEGRRQRQEEGLRRQTRKEDIREEERGHQEAAEQQRIGRERERESEREQQQQSMGDSYGSTGKVQPEISMADRAKSKSTADLDHVEKPEIKVTSSDRLGEASWIKGQQSLPQAALERQQIPLESKKTRLRPDNSWICQRSTSKHPAAGPIRRGKSLDNLDIARCSSWRSSWTPESPSSIPSYSWPHSGLSGLNTYSWPHSGLSGLNTYSGGVRGHSGSATMPSSLSMSSLRGAGGGSNLSSWSQSSPSPSPSSPNPSTGPKSESLISLHESSRTVSGKKICTFCDTALVKGAAMVIESLGLVYHLTCFKCIDCKSELLGASEAGAESSVVERKGIGRYLSNSLLW